jgi:hypothetical protein
MLRLDGRGERLSLVLEPAEVPRARARGGGWAVSHLERDVPAGLRSALDALAAHLEALGSAPRDLEAVVGALRQAPLGAKGPLTLTAGRRLLAGQRLRRWPLTLRSGAPDPGAGHPWPYDCELAALEIGLRSLVLRQDEDPRALEADERWLVSRGLHVRRAGDSGRPGETCLLGGREPAVLDAGEALLAAATTGGGGRPPESLHRLGALLGYPACCVARYLSAGRRDDRFALAELLPAPVHPPAPILGVWACEALRLFSHVPCRIDCPPTLALAEKTLARLGDAYPGFEAIWRDLAGRLHILDREGGVQSLKVNGRLDDGDGVTVTQATTLVPPAPDGGVDARGRGPALEGTRLRIERGYLVGEGLPGGRATLFVDHRAGGVRVHGARR